MPFLTYCKLVVSDTFAMPEHIRLKQWYQFRAFSEVYLHQNNQEIQHNYPEIEELLYLVVGHA